MSATAREKLTPEKFIEQLGRYRASAILRTTDGAAGRKAMQAAVRGGFRVIEFTLTVPGALELIAEFAEQPDAIVGAGTVLTVEQARDAVAAGAQFLVSPVMDVDVIREATKLGVASMPGCATPTEMLTAYRAGAPLQKLFPAPGTGPAFVQQTLGPMPFLKIVPTSGVTLENAAEYLRAGSTAVGFVASLFEAADLAAGRFEVIEERARKMVAAVSGE